MYESGTGFKMIGDYAITCKRLFEEEKISENHYFNLMVDTRVNIDEKIEGDEGNGEPKILLDCDVFIHFLKGGKILELPKIFPGRFVMLYKIKTQLIGNSDKLAVGIFIIAAGVPLIPMTTEEPIVRDYFQLRKTMEYGESA